MTFTPQENGFKVTKEYFSVTLNQQFNDGKFVKQSGTGMLCIPHVQFSNDPNRKIVRLRMDWGFMMKDVVEFFADDIYHVFYFDYENEKQCIENLISVSRASFEKFFLLKFPGTLNIDLKDFFNQANELVLRDDILSKIHSRDKMA